MDSVESNNSDLGWCGKEICSAHPNWLAENVEGIDQKIKQMVKIIEQVVDLPGKNPESVYQKRLQLIALLEEINQGHQGLAKQYRHLLENGAVSQAYQDSSLMTPDKNLGIQKAQLQSVCFDFSSSSGGNSSNVSGKEGSQSSSLLSSDSDSEEMLKGEYMDMPAGLSKKGVPIMRETDDYNMLLSRITKYEGELIASNEKFRSAEDKIMKLKSDLDNALVTRDNWKAQLETANNEVKLMEVDLDVEKRKVSELQMQAAMLETKVLDSGCRIQTLVDELQLMSKQLGISEAEVSELKHEQSERENEIGKLTVALQDALRNSEMENAIFQCHNSTLTENLSHLEARLAEREAQIKSLENENRRCEASKLEMKSLYEAQEIRWQGDIEGLKVQLNEKRELVESLNKSQDRLKLNYDMLMAEKDGLNAKVQTLAAELCSRGNNIRQLEDQLHQLQSHNKELIMSSENALMLRDELRLKVEKLEKEVAKQAAIISDSAEEKREAIRQLCFSLEHYRTGYQELRQAYVGQRRHAVIAS